MKGKTRQVFALGLPFSTCGKVSPLTFNACSNSFGERGPLILRRFVQIEPVTPDERNKRRRDIRPAAQRALMDEIGAALGVKEFADWYPIHRKQVQALGGWWLLKRYTNLEGVLRTVYPEYNWQKTSFGVIPPSFWDDPEHQKEFVEKISLELGIQQPSDWYAVSHSEFIKRGGRPLLQKHGSLEKVLRTLYPDHPWDILGFLRNGKAPKGFWRDVNNQKLFLEHIGAEMNIKQLSDWYSVTRKEISTRGGWGIFKQHLSWEVALRAIYPDYPWDSNRFKEEGGVPPGYWKDRDNVRNALERAQNQLSIKSPEDWYSITLADLQEVGFPRNVTKPQLVEILRELYPTYQFDDTLLQRGKYNQQSRLARAVASLFPNTEITVNERKSGKLLNPETKHSLELDIYLPSLKLAFEFQEIHHFAPSNYAFETLPVYQQRDQMKRELAAEKDLTLITIPFWWDGRLNSLIATIKKHRPDLLPKELALPEDVIPEEMPPEFLSKQTDNVPDIGHPMLASFFTLSSIDPTSWWMFEKYDGVRGFWNPLKKTMYTRRGLKLRMPQDVIDAMPSDTFLDGELWFGRDNFQEAGKMATKMELSGLDWSKFKYMVFDAPNQEGSYEERYQRLVGICDGEKYKYLSLAPKEPCTGVEHMEKFFQDVIDKGGEGIILRDPSAPLQPGRSAGYLKHKKFRDAEAKIISKVALQRWECELPNGIRFVASANSMEFARRFDPQPGDVVSFKHHGFLYSSKKPKLPTLYRMRKDLAWEDVVNNWKENKVSPRGGLPKIKKRKSVRRGHWQDIENRKKYLVGLANKLGFDPSVPEPWTRVTQSQIAQNKGRGLLKNFNGSVKDILLSTFPEFKSSFVYKQTHKYWKNTEACRTFFDELAKEQNFDPLNPVEWYSMDWRRVLVKKSGLKIQMRSYLGFKKALIAAYPEVQFTKWTEREQSVWTDPKELRAFFDDIAQQKGFNPRTEEGWSFNLKQLLVIKGVAKIQLANGGLKKAIQKAYPEVVFHKWQKLK